MNYVINCLKYKLSIILVFFLIFLTGCKPDDMEFIIYSSDFLNSRNEKVIEIPVKITFSSFTQDKDNMFEKGVEAAKSYLSPDSTFSISQGNYSKFLVIKTKFPLGESDSINEYLKINSRLGYLIVNENEITFMPTKKIKELNSILSDIDLFLDLDMPARKTRFRIISDSEKPFGITAYSIWVSKAPYLKLEKKLKKRDEIEILFKGGDDSIWSQINPKILFDSNNFLKVDDETKIESLF